MENIEYPNAKMKFFGTLLAPLIDYLHARHIFSGLLFILPAVFYMYIKLIKNRPQKKKLTWIEKGWIFVGISALLICISAQISMITNPPTHP